MQSTKLYTDRHGQLGLDQVPQQPPHALVVDDAYESTSEASSCDDEDNADRRPFCFFCDAPSRSRSPVAVDQRQLAALKKLLVKDVGRCDPRQIARNAHCYYMHAIFKPARKRGDRGVRVWRTRDVLRHMREHSRNPMYARDRDLRLLGRLSRSLAGTVRRLVRENARSSDVLRTTSTLRRVIMLERRLSLQPLMNEREATEAIVASTTYTASHAQLGTWYAVD